MALCDAGAPDPFPPFASTLARVGGNLCPVSELALTNHSPAPTAMNSALAKPVFFQPLSPFSDLGRPGNAVFLSSERAANVRLRLVVACAIAGRRSSQTHKERTAGCNEQNFASRGSCPSPPPNLALSATTTIPSLSLGPDVNVSPVPWLPTTETVSLRSLALGYPKNWTLICRPPPP